MKKNLIKFIVTALIFLCFAGAASGSKVRAEEAGRVTVGDIDYERLTMKIYKNGNTNVYFSTTLASNLSGWDEISGVASNDGNGTYLLVDISWASASSDVKFYLRGDKNTTATEVVLPKISSSFRAVFDKVNGDFTFSGQDDRDYFYFRKSTDYNWMKVYFEGMGSPAQGSSSEMSYEEFLNAVEMLRFKGAKLVFKLGQIVGVDEENTGSRPSREINVSVTKYSSSPSIKLNITKLTFNTKATMEWSDDMNTWSECEKNMELADLAPKALLGAGKSSGSEDVVLFFRIAATEKKPCSQIAVFVVPAQESAPSVGAGNSSTVNYSYDNNKLLLNFTDASSENAYEYCVIAADKTFSESTAKWKTVKSTKTVSLTKKSVDGGTVYIRRKGTLENLRKNIEFKLPSAAASFVVNGFK